ncbi:alpha/beta fold hydrolase [Streptomyces sp. NPDC058583]|uniref:alpha/beta fold hydrolase n=1 Tax=unclassified Streptomyces TaxID=2593676 RepID=UPI0036672980
MLVHGVGSTAEAWTDIVERLLAALPEISVLRLDLRAHGASTLGTAGVSVGLLARDLAHVIDAFAPDRVVLAGHSLGGQVCLALAEEHPEWLGPHRIVGMLLAATSSGGPAPTAPPDGPEPLGTLTRLKGLVVVTACLWRRQPTEAAISYYKAMVAHRSGDLRALRASAVHVVGGGRDPWMPPSHVKNLAQRIVGSHLRILPGVGHDIPSQRPQLLVDQLSHLVRKTQHSSHEGVHSNDRARH